VSAVPPPAERYRRREVLGHGGMATVQLAQDTELDRPVALKLLADNLAANEEFKERFLREARLAARLSHPNIVAVYDVGEEDGRPFIVMEYVEGEPLSDLLEARGRLEPEEARSLALQACAGLAVAHDAGLVHRDIKPQNLLVTPGGTLKIADFGIARSLDGTRLTQAGTVLGTAGYLAPEQAAGEDVTAAGDVYSLGAVLYELLTGRPPYDADSLAELFVKQRDGAIVPVRELAPKVPAKLEDAVMRALARMPEYRPDSAAAFADELVGPTTAVTLVDRPQRARRSTRERVPRWALPAALVLLAGTLALVLALSLGGSDKPATPGPPAAGGSPAQQAHAFASWLREHASGA
jgi:eukaryotic-like serine/threonine-protein kinase